MTQPPPTPEELKRGDLAQGETYTAPGITVHRDSPPLLRVYLDISGDFDPAAFSRTVGLVADEMRRRGQPLFAHLDRPAQVARTLKVDDWKLKVPTRHTFFISDVLDELLERVEGHEAKIRGTAQALGLDVVLQVVAEWETPTTSNPVFGLTVLQMERLVNLGADYDVDFYPLTLHEADR